MSSNTNRSIVISQPVKLLSFSAIPTLPESLNKNNVIEYLIPKGFEECFSAEIGINGELELVFTNAENQYDDRVVVPEYIYNPLKYGAVFAKFLFQISTISKGLRPDYLGKDRQCILNQNQVLYTIIHHRASLLRTYSRQYIGLLRADISRLRNMIDFVTPNTFNAKAKFNNAYCIINAFASNSVPNAPRWKTVPGTINEYPLGEIIDCKNSIHKPSEQVLKAVLADIHMQPGSDSMLQKQAKVVISDDNGLYQAPGYCIKEINGAPHVISIFDRKQNMPARLKTHLLTDGFQAVDYIEKPVYLQDMIFGVNGSLRAKDYCLLPAIVVFHDMDVHTGRFVFGEIEQSERLASRHIIKREIIHQQFIEITAKVGSRCVDGELYLGTDLDEQPVVLKGLIDAIVVAITTDDLNQSAKIVVNCTLEAGNARILTATGMKGFTKTIPQLGHITLGDDTQLPVDLITGMNAVKAKQNTIVLARAALACKLGMCGDKQYLDSLKPNQINNAARKIQKVEYTDIYGNKSMVWAGYVEYYVTEISSMYAKFKPQNFMFEVGKYLQMQNDKSLFNHIWDECLDERAVSIAKELHKVLQDTTGVCAVADDLPVYTPDQLRTIFEKKDLVLVSQSRWDTDSRLFDPEINKGFYIDMRALKSVDGEGISHNGPMIRILSGKTLASLKGQLPNGEFIYPKIISAISRIMQAILIRGQHGSYNFGFIWNTKNDTHLYSGYMKEVLGMLYTNDEKGMTMAQSLIKPQVMGVNMKQITDHLVPWDVVVIYDRNIYHNMQAYVMSDEYENKHLGAITMHGKEMYGMPIRNPSLWKTQIHRARIWGEEEFNAYLRSIGVDPKKHISGKYCRHSILISPYITLIQHSDNDGDILPMFVLKASGQAILRDFKLDNVSYEEAKWTLDFYFGECEANDDLHAEPIYQLYVTPMQHSNQDTRTYSEFLLNASIAKSNIGSATSDIWALYAILQLYKAFCATRKSDDPSLYDEFIQPWRKKSPKAPLSVSDDELSQISYVYTRLVEEYVINAIKHMEGGSAHFKIYYLRNMTTNENIKTVYNKMVQEFGLSPRACSTLMDIIEWAKQNGVMAAVKDFIRLYNKGETATDANSHKLFKHIANHTFFGSLVMDLYDVSTVIETANMNGFSYSKYAELKDYGINNVIDGVADAAKEAADEEWLSGLFG